MVQHVYNREAAFSYGMLMLFQSMKCTSQHKLDTKIEILESGTRILYTLNRHP